MDVCDHEQPASDPPRSTCYLGARVAPLANRPSAAVRHNGILEVPYDPSLRLNGVSDHHLQETSFPDELATTSFRHNGAHNLRFRETSLPDESDATTSFRHIIAMLQATYSDDAKDCKRFVLSCSVLHESGHVLRPSERGLGHLSRDIPEAVRVVISIDL